MFEKKVLEMLYQKAAAPEDLPWHGTEPPKLLVDAIKHRNKPGKALDVGCGAGTYSIYLAKQGYEVTGLDFIPQALEMAQEKCRAEKVKINWIQADLLEWRSAGRFDLVFDLGALHTISSEKMEKYKQQLLTWLQPEADFVLVHWGRRHLLDWRPIGPRRRTRPALVRFFSPELREKAHHCEIMPFPLPVGPSALVQSFWLQPS